MNFENIVIFLPNDNRVLNFVPNVINLYIYFQENLQNVRRSPLKDVPKLFVYNLAMQVSRLHQSNTILHLKAIPEWLSYMCGIVMVLL